MTTPIRRTIPALLLAALPLLPAAAAGQDGRKPAAVVVSPDGKGDFDSIAAALAGAEPGATIRVNPGTYGEFLVVSRDVVVEGTGKAEEVVVFTEGVPCLDSSAKKALFRNVTFRCVAKRGDPVPAVSVEAGELTLESCGVAPGAGRGVAARGKDSVLVVRGTAVGEPLELAVHAVDGARVSLEKCAITGGAHSGAYVAEAELSLRETAVVGKGGSGVVVMEGGKAAIDGGRIAGFPSNGISVKGGTLAARGCVIDGCGEAGVFVHGKGKATLDDVEVGGSGSFEVLGRGESHLLLRKCRVKDGRMHGLVGETGSEVTAEESEFTGCARSGAGSKTAATVILRRCLLRKNEQAGAWVMEGGVLLVEESKVLENGMCGLDASGPGRMTVRRCLVQRNGQFGVMFREKSEGAVERCDLTKNDQGGLRINPEAKVKASGNRD